MPDNKDKLTTQSTPANLTRKHSVSLPGLHARLKNPVAVQDRAETVPNRIGLLLDVSGSMSGDKIVSLRDACTSFISACDFSNTALALEPFGQGDPPPSRLPLTCFAPILTTTTQMLRANGGTPMAQAMHYAIHAWPLTRAVLVSDGQPDSEAAAYVEANNFKAAEVPCDCVHIGHDRGGEECLRRVAEITGGQFIKFTDINSFAKSFKYLTPAYYAQLTSGAVTVEQLGGKR